jgi:hypothetical protein
LSDDQFMEALDQEVEFRKWEFEEGDTLVGTVLSIFDGDGDYGPYKGYVVTPEQENTTEDGGSAEAVSADDPLVWYVNDNSAAARSIPQSGIAVGDRLGVKYVGERTSKADRTFKKFNVKVQKPDLVAD